MILVLLAFVGCAKDKPTFNALDKFFDCLGDSSKWRQKKTV